VLYDQMRETYERLSEAELVEKVLSDLTQMRCLVVLDNLETLFQSEELWAPYGEFLAGWLGRSGGGYVVLTSQYRLELPMGKVWDWIGLQGLVAAQGIALLKAEGVIGEERDLAAFVDAADGHPLLLTLAVNLLKKREKDDWEEPEIVQLGLDGVSMLRGIMELHRGDAEASVGKVLDESFERLYPAWLRVLLWRLSVLRGKFGLEMAQEMMNEPVEIVDLRRLVRWSFLQEEKVGTGWQFAFSPLIGRYLQIGATDAEQLEAGHSAAIRFYATNLKIGDKTIKDPQGVFEVSYHLCQLARHSLAYDLMDIYIGQFYRQGYYREIVDLYEPLTQEWSLEEHIGGEDSVKLGWALNLLGAAYRALGEYQKSINFHDRSLTIQRALSDRGGEGGTLHNLGYAYESLGNYQQAIIYYEEALLINREVENRNFEANSLGNLGSIYGHFGEYHKAIGYHQESLKIKRDINDRDGEGGSLCNIGLMHSHLGQYTKAIDFYKKALEIQREVGNRQFESNSLGNLGDIYHTLEEYKSSLDFYMQSLELKRAIGDRRGEASNFDGLGNVYRSLGKYKKAIDFHQQSIEIKREIRDYHGEGISLGNLGIAYAALGEYQKATDSYQQSLKIKREVGDRDGQGGTLFNMGHVLVKLNSRKEAVECFQQARSIYQELQLKNMVEQCEANIQIHDQEIAKKQRSQRLRLFLILFCIGLVIMFLIHWLKR
jgi:tetratricopeptide (TPR) repeat protein